MFNAFIAHQHLYPTMYRISDRIMGNTLNDLLVYSTNLISSPAQKDLEYFISPSFCFWDTVASACRRSNAPLKTSNSFFWAAENSMRQWYLVRFTLLLPASEGFPSCSALAIVLLSTTSQLQHRFYSSRVVQLTCKLHQNQAELLVARTRKRRDLNVPSLGCCCADVGPEKGCFKLFMYKLKRKPDLMFFQGRA